MSPSIFVGTREDFFATLVFFDQQETDTDLRSCKISYSSLTLFECFVCFIYCWMAV